MKKYVLFLLMFITTLTVYSQLHKNMVEIPAGEYHMKLKFEDLGLVTIHRFLMDKYEVTVADYEKFIKATRYKSDSEKRGFTICVRDTIWGANWRCDSKGKPRPQREYNRPVIHVSINDANEYSKWAGKRLPREVEWMYVASQKNPQRIDDIAWYQDNSTVGDYRDVQEVGTKLPNLLGIFDLIGNVEEITTSFNQGVYIGKGCCFWDFKENFFGNDPIVRQLVIMQQNYTCERFGFRCVKDIY